MQYPLENQFIVAFYESTDIHGWMANTYRNYPITIDNQFWPTCEHYFQAMKFPGSHPAEVAYRQAILNYQGPYSQFPQAARKIEKEVFEREGYPPDYQTQQERTNHWQAWDNRKLNIMRTAVRTKLDQHTDLQNHLLALPDNTFIIEALPENLLHHPHKDTFWADGGDGSGENQLGLIYTEELIRRKKILSEEAAIQREAKKRNDDFQNARHKRFPGQTAYKIGEHANPLPTLAVDQKAGVTQFNENTNQKLVDFFLTSDYHVKPTSTSKCIEIVHQDDRPLFTIEPHQIKAAKKLDDNQYVILLKAGQIAFPGKKLSLSIPEADREKAEAAIKQVTGIKVTLNTRSSKKNNEEEPPKKTESDQTTKKPLPDIKHGAWYNMDQIDSVLRLSAYGNPNIHVIDFHEYRIRKKLSHDDPQKFYFKVRSQSEDSADINSFQERIKESLISLLEYRTKHGIEQDFTVVFYAHVGGNHYATYACNIKKDQPSELLVINTYPGYEEWNNTATMTMQNTLQEKGVRVNEKPIVIKSTQPDASSCGAMTAEAARAIDAKRSFSDQQNQLTQMMTQACKKENTAKIRRIHHKLNKVSTDIPLDLSSVDIENFQSNPQRLNGLKNKYNSFKVQVDRDVPSLIAQLDELLLPKSYFSSLFKPKSTDSEEKLPKNSSSPKPI